MNLNVRNDPYLMLNNVMIYLQLEQLKENLNVVKIISK